MKLLRNNWIFTVLAVVIFGIGGYLLYESQQTPDLNGNDAPVETPETPTPPAKAPVGETSQGGHFHADGTWHEGPHEAHTPAEGTTPEVQGAPGGAQQGVEVSPHPGHLSPTAEGSEPVTPVAEKPAYIYDPDKEKPDGWDPELLWDTGHHKIIDLNYRPLTEEEQAEYERLKATLVPPEDYGVTEAGLRITAIGNIKTKNSETFLQSLWTEEDAGRITREEARKQLRDYWEFFSD